MKPFIVLAVVLVLLTVAGLTQTPHGIPSGIGWGVLVLLAISGLIIHNRS